MKESWASKVKCFFRRIICKITGHEYGCCGWKPIPCPRCGGPLSELRKYRYGGGPIGELAKYHGQWYRHCYSCHSEFFAEG